MTFSALKDAVANICKAGIAYSSEADAVVETALKLVWRGFVETRPIEERSINRKDVNITAIIADKGIVKLDSVNRVFGIREVRFKSGTDEWTLMEEGTRVPPSPIPDKPRAWREVGYLDIAGLAAGNGDHLYIEPYIAIDQAADKLYVSYYKAGDYLASIADGVDPAEVSYADTFSAGTSRWDQELVDMAAAYVLGNFYKKPDQAAILMAKYKTPTPPQNNQQ